MMCDIPRLKFAETGVAKKAEAGFPGRFLLPID